jgi:hypothetical protein
MMPVEQLNLQLWMTSMSTLSSISLFVVQISGREQTQRKAFDDSPMPA